MPQNAAAVLTEALGRVGPGALPYAPEFRYLVQQHMTELVTDLPSLQVKTREYMHIDGRGVELLLAEGTLPMYYQEHKYNIPVAVWLPEQYPLAAPMAYVVPTPTMIVKPRHSFVDASGLVHTPYINQWQYPVSNLRDMAQDMAIHFGDDPPLFSERKSWGPGGGGNPAAAAAAAWPPQRPPPVAQYGGDTLHVNNPLAQSGASYGGLAGSAFAAPGPPSANQPMAGAPGPSTAAAASATAGGFESVWAAMMAASSGQQQQQQQPVPAPQQQQPPPPPPRENPSVKLAAAFRTAAIASLNKRVNTSLTAIGQQAEAQAKEQLELQASLRQRGEQLQAEVATLQADRVALDKLSQELASSSAQLDSWLTQNEHLAKAAEDPSQLDVDAVITAADPLSQQALEVQAQDLALEDALYALDKALGQGGVEGDAYLKQVRAVCRRQFFVRVIGNKVAAQQQDEQRRAPRTQQQQYLHPELDVQRTLSAGRPVVLPQGDSWANAGIAAASRPEATATSWYPAS